MKKPCPGALGAIGVPAHRWRTRVDLFDQIAEARQYFDTASLPTVSIAEGAKRAGLSDFHFVRLFHEVVGMAPSDYLAGRKLTHAAKLLHDSDGSVMEIAIECGYQNASAFGRAFKRRHQISPAQYRKRSRLPADS